MLLIILSACNLPHSKSLSNGPEIATNVAQTITSIPKNTKTLRPTMHPAPAKTMTPSPIPTESPTITNTPTTIQDNPAKTLGIPTWKDDLENGTAFFKDKPWISDDGYNRFSVANGKMTITNLGAGRGYLGWRLAPRTPKNFYLEATFTTRTCSSSDQYGLVFRATDFSSGFGYYVEITCDGQFSLSRWDNSGKSLILNKISNYKILSGENKTNRLGVMANANSIKLYANSKLFQEVKDSTFLDRGYIGPFIAGQTCGFTVEMSEIAYWDLP